jgi:acylphosphatase
MSHSQTATLVRIQGRVQGVGFRYWTRDEAWDLGLTGWVRNEPDGSVMAMIAGPETAVAIMLQRLRGGPPGAKVTNLTAEGAVAPDLDRHFRILP